MLWQLHTERSPGEKVVTFNVGYEKQEGPENRPAHCVNEAHIAINNLW